MTATIIDQTKHAVRRRLISQALTTSAIKSMENQMLDSAGLFCDEISRKDHQEHTPSGQEWCNAINVTDWFARLAYDIIGDLCIGRKWDVLSSEQNRMSVQIISECLTGTLLAGYMPAVLTLKLHRIFFRGLINRADHLKDTNREQLQQRTKEYRDCSTKVQDIFEKLLGARDIESGQGLTSSELHCELVGPLIAGSDTTATTMTATIFYLLHYPSTFARLRDEIDQTFNSVEEITTGSRLTSCSYLRACSDEILRLNLPVGGILPRQVPSGGITIEGNFSPPGTEIGTSIYALHHRQGYFVNPSVYAPQRWLGDKILGVSQEGLAAFNPFSMGPRGCPAKAMAYTEMMLTLARMVWLFDMRLKEGIRCVGGNVGKAVVFETWDCFTSKHDGPMVEFKKRSR